MDCEPGSSCITSAFTEQNGTKLILHSCVPKENCGNIDALCQAALQLQAHAKSCVAECCDTDNCNNNYDFMTTTAMPPTSATGVIVSKFTLSLMVLAGFLLAII